MKRRIADIIETVALIAALGVTAFEDYLGIPDGVFTLLVVVAICAIVYNFFLKWGDGDDDDGDDDNEQVPDGWILYKNGWANYDLVVFWLVGGTTPYFFLCGRIVSAEEMDGGTLFTTESNKFFCRWDRYNRSQLVMGERLESIPPGGDVADMIHGKWIPVTGENKEKL